MSAAEMIAGMFRYESRAGAGPMQIASSARCTGRLWASASLYTSTDWIPSSRQARMTRSAISPLFAMRTLSKDRKRLPQCGLVGDIRRRRRSDDAFREPGQDIPRTELHEGGRALPFRAPHGGDPLYPRPNLFLQQFREIGRMFVHFRIDIRDDGQAKRIPTRFRELFRQIASDRTHGR